MSTQPALRVWISVAEQLPAVGTWCDVLLDRNEGDFFDRLNKPRYSVYGARLRSVDGEGYATWERWALPSGTPICPLYLVTHWMPLPEPPAGTMSKEIDLKHAAYDALQKAAQESNWIPAEYSADNWLSDCCEFLRSRGGAVDEIERLREALKCYDLAIKEAEAILGGEYAMSYGPFFDLVEQAKRLR